MFSTLTIAIANALFFGSMGFIGARGMMKPDAKRKFLKSLIVAIPCALFPYLGVGMLAFRFVRAGFIRRFGTRAERKAARAARRAERRAERRKIASVRKHGNKLEREVVRLKASLEKQYNRMMEFEKYVEAKRKAREKRDAERKVPGNNADLERDGRRLEKMQAKVQQTRSELEAKLLMLGRIQNSLKGVRETPISAIRMTVSSSDPNDRRFVLPNNVSREVIAEMKASICQKYGLPLNTDRITVGEHAQDNFEVGYSLQEGVQSTTIVYDAKTKALADYGGELDKGFEKKIREANEKLEKDTEGLSEIRAEISSLGRELDASGELAHREAETPVQEEMSELDAFLKAQREKDAKEDAEEEVIEAAEASEGETYQREVFGLETEEIERMEKTVKEEEAEAAREPERGTDVMDERTARQREKMTAALTKDVMKVTILGPDSVGIVMNNKLIAYAVSGKNGQVYFTGVDSTNLTGKDLLKASRLNVDLEGVASMAEWVDKACSLVSSGENLRQLSDNVERVKRDVDRYKKHRRSVDKVLSMAETRSESRGRAR